MPTYVYRREDGTTFETVQRITDDALTEDPETGLKVERVISGGAGLQFKGTGFYLTDYGRSGSDNGPSKEKKDDDTPSDAKPEKKVEAKSEAVSTKKEAKATKESKTPGSAKE